MLIKKQTDDSPSEKDHMERGEGCVRVCVCVCEQSTGMQQQFLVWILKSPGPVSSSKKIKARVANIFSSAQYIKPETLFL